MNEATLSAMRQPKPHTGAWLSIGSPVIAELAAAYPFNWMLFDLEHGCGTEATLLSNLQAAKRDHLAMIVRPGQIDPVLISRALDWGASGIMMPHINTAEQARKCLLAMQYPPLGNRGYSSSARAFQYGIKTPDKQTVLQQPLFFAQIETQEGVQHAEAIAATTGVDVLFVGPADLKWELTSKGLLPENGFDSYLTKVVKAAVVHGKQAGIVAKNDEEFANYLKMGFTCISYASDLAFLKQGFQHVKEKFL